MPTPEIADSLSQLTISDNECTTKPGIKCVPSSFKFHSFSKDIQDTNYQYHVMLMEGSVFIWIGNQLVFNQLAMAMIPVVTGIPTGSVLYGDAIGNSSLLIAKRLSKRLGKPAFVSCNIVDNKLIISQMEKVLYDEINRFPNKF